MAFGDGACPQAHDVGPGGELAVHRAAAVGAEDAEFVGAGFVGREQFLALQQGEQRCLHRCVRHEGCALCAFALVAVAHGQFGDLAVVLVLHAAAQATSFQHGGAPARWMVVTVHSTPLFQVTITRDRMFTPS